MRPATCAAGRSAGVAAYTAAASSPPVDAANECVTQGIARLLPPGGLPPPGTSASDAGPGRLMKASCMSNCVLQPAARSCFCVYLNASSSSGVPDNLTHRASASVSPMRRFVLTVSYGGATAFLAILVLPQPSIQRPPSTLIV